MKRVSRLATSLLLLAAAAAVLLALRFAYRQQASPHLLELAENPAALGKAFNAAGDKLRVLAIVSPT
jgi:hypothetical protein